MNNPTDWVLQLIEGDERALRGLYDRYIHRVYHFVYGYIKDKADSEDVAQSIFVKLWEKRNAVDPGKPFDVFLFTIAYRAVIDHFRQKETRRQKNTSHHLDEEAHVSTLTAEDSLRRHELESLYQRAVQTLPPKRKEIFLLSRHGGLTNAQIAEQLNISVKTVENQMTAALASLKEFFRQSESGVLFFFFFFFGG